MQKISFNDFKQIMLYDVIKNNACIEIEFCVEGSKEYTSCWLGKTAAAETSNETYWFGLTSDGLQAYDFDILEDFVNTGVFKGRSLKEIWNFVCIYSIDGCDIKERVPFYLGLEDGPIRGPAKYTNNDFNDDKKEK